MSLWNRAQHLPQHILKQVQNLYNEEFPMEVRHYLAGWFEERIHQWNAVDPDNPSDRPHAYVLVSQLIQEMENKAMTCSNQEDFFIMHMRLTNTANLFRTRYLDTNPLSLVAIIRNCLNTELDLVQRHENVSGGTENGPHLIKKPGIEIEQELEVLFRLTSDSAQDLTLLEHEQQSFVYQYQECTTIKARLSHLQTLETTPQNRDLALNLSKEMEASEQQLAQKVSGLVQRRMTLAEKHKGTLDRLNILQNRILNDELVKWKREQQLSGNGRLFIMNKIDQIQKWCEALADIIWSNRHQIKECERYQAHIPISPRGSVDMVPTLKKQIDHLLGWLVSSTLIIEKQPPQVIKTNTKFSATVRLLIGGSQLNVYKTPPTVNVRMLTEAQASALGNDQTHKGKQPVVIVNSTNILEYNERSRQLSVSFRNMKFDKPERGDKKATETVMDEKFGLLFQTKFSVGGGELVYQVSALSLPVVAIVHTNQEAHAVGTIAWDTEFTELGRSPFTVPEAMLWPQIAQMLDSKFKAATGRGLTKDNLKFLAAKAFCLDSSQVHDFDSLWLPLTKFNREPLPNRGFTFWDWFYAAMKVTRDHLCHPWNDGSIIGFVDRQSTEDMLKDSVSGTFMLRFSDSELGGVTIAWMHEDFSKVTDRRSVFMLQPFDSKQLAIRSLADSVADLHHLLYLYPNIAKGEAFGKYYTSQVEEPPKKNGYVQSRPIIHVPGWSTAGAYPNSTPNSIDDMYGSPLCNPSSISSDGSGSITSIDQYDEYLNDINLDKTLLQGLCLLEK